MTEDETVGWHHRLNGHEFQQTAEMVKDGEAWRAAVHGVQRVGHDLGMSCPTAINEQQQ